MKRKVAVLLLLGLILSGCSLAQPEAGNTGDRRFAGLFMVFEKNDFDGKDAFYDNPALVEAGSQMLATEYGKVPVPRYRLPAEEQDGTYIFPGMEGRCLFLVHQEGENGPYTRVISDVGSGESNINITDEGTSYSISGTVYTGPPLDAGPDWNLYEQGGTVTFYRVYESPEGQIYLDGSGNSSSAGSCGAAYQEERTASVSDGTGETKSETISVKVNIQYAPRLESLAVSQFDENNTLLCASELPPQDSLPEVVCLPETAWVLVEERSADGTARTLYSAPREDEEPCAVHNIVLLDSDGWGRTAALNIRFP